MIFWQFGTLHAGTIFKKWCRTISNIQITWGVVSWWGALINKYNH